MEEQTIFVIFPSKTEIQNYHDKPYYEFLWTNSSLVLRKYLKCTGTDEELVRPMTHSVFEKFKKRMEDDQKDYEVDFLELHDQGGGIALPDEFVEAIEEASSDVIFEVKHLAKDLIADLRYFKDPEIIKVKKSLHKLLKYFKKNPMVSLDEFKYNKIVKEYYQRKDEE